MEYTIRNIFNGNHDILHPYLRIVDEQHNILFDRMDEKITIPEQYMDREMYWYHDSLICDDGISREIICLRDEK